MGVVEGPVRRGDGIAPAVALVDPKFPHNVGAAVRAASCYGIRQVWFSSFGPRSARPARAASRPYARPSLALWSLRSRRTQSRPSGRSMPRLAGHQSRSQSLIDFDHPDRALYVFGAEDGSLGKAVLRHCHRFVIIPTRHCTNLSAAVYTMLYDRHAKRVRAGLEPAHRLAESRGRSFSEGSSMMDEVGLTWGR